MEQGLKNIHLVKFEFFTKYKPQLLKGLRIYFNWMTWIQINSEVLSKCAFSRYLNLKNTLIQELWNWFEFSTQTLKFVGSKFFLVGTNIINQFVLPKSAISLLFKQKNQFAEIFTIAGANPHSLLNSHIFADIQSVVNNGQKLCWHAPNGWNNVVGDRTMLFQNTHTYFNILSHWLVSNFKPNTFSVFPITSGKWDGNINLY